MNKRVQQIATVGFITVIIVFASRLVLASPIEKPEELPLTQVHKQEMVQSSIDLCDAKVDELAALSILGLTQEGLDLLDFLYPFTESGDRALNLVNCAEWNANILKDHAYPKQ